MESQIIADIATIKERVEGIGRTLVRIEKSLEADKTNIKCNSDEILKMKTTNKVFTAIASLVASAVGGFIGLFWR